MFDRKSWQPDGLGYRARIGLLTPNDDAVPESEFWTMAPEGVSVHVSRVLLVDTRTFGDPPHPDDATALLAALPMQAIVFTFTTTSYILGPDGEQALKARLEKRSNGIPVLFVGPAAVAAFRALNVRRIALIHPPWFTDDEQQLGVTYFRSQGFDVVYANQMRLRGFAVAKPTHCASLPRGIPRRFTHLRARRSRPRPKLYSLAGTASEQLVRLQHPKKILVGQCSPAIRWLSGTRCAKPVCISQ